MNAPRCSETLCSASAPPPKVEGGTPNKERLPNEANPSSAAVFGCGLQHRLDACGETPHEPAGEDACATGIYQTKPSLGARFKVSSSRFKVAGRTETPRIARVARELPNEPIAPEEREKGRRGERENFTKRTHRTLDRRFQISDLKLAGICFRHLSAASVRAIRG